MQDSKKECFRSTECSPTLVTITQLPSAAVVAVMHESDAIPARFLGVPSMQYGSLTCTVTLPIRAYSNNVHEQGVHEQCSRTPSEHEDEHVHEHG